MSWGTNKEPRLEERPSAPIHLRPVTLALRAPEGTLRRRPYTTHYNYMMCTTQLKGRFCTHGNGVLRPGSVASLPLLQSQSQSFKHPSRRVSNQTLISSRWVEIPNTRNKGGLFNVWFLAEAPNSGIQKRRKICRRNEKYVEETKIMKNWNPQIGTTKESCA